MFHVQVWQRFLTGPRTCTLYSVVYKVYVGRKTTSSVMRTNNMETKTLSAPSSTTGTNSSSRSSTTGTKSSNSTFPSLWVSARTRSHSNLPQRSPGSISAAVNLYVYERMQQTVDGVIL